ncbi:hypothetical protein Pmar_PMAR021416 [Perkinsus marinus ATCC 50983]|uniref:Uncharacterized protein n=1 Tax=Perkinsus marinus (strain ATCC 50983 / TXsc) TaxID=423536 RepID=C5KX80_PERM5|nr:hypothetical protein Pmar_PMAR021416 [Perkinsus marinus ATCC 50983]EER10936.1 hypothetical protein Pmar_PMAR021416 [Perkinsus marinus ATCC 50983]|eukprot:XP_002779141.1 hypothetical protein Pmar_PMAR021416 [Perkinsus marinus ATCC 50983]
MGADRPTDGEAWDLVEEINELSRGELEVIEEHEKEFDRLVFSATPPDLQTLEEDNSSSVVLPAITVSVEYEPPVDELDEVIAAQTDGVSSIDIPLDFDEEPLLGYTIHPDPPPPLNAAEDLPAMPPQKMVTKLPSHFTSSLPLQVDIQPITVPPLEYFPDTIGPAVLYNVENIPERQLPDFDVPLQPTAPISAPSPLPQQFEQDPDGYVPPNKLEVTLAPERDDIWEKDRGMDIDKLVHEELLQSIDANVLYGQPKTIEMNDDGAATRLMEQIEDRLTPKTITEKYRKTSTLQKDGDDVELQANGGPYNSSQKEIFLSPTDEISTPRGGDDELQPGTVLEDSSGNIKGRKTVKPDAPMIDLLPRGKSPAEIGDAYIRLPTRAYSCLDSDRHLRPNRGRLVQPDPSLIMDTRLRTQTITERDHNDTTSRALEDVEDALENRGVEVLMSCVRHNRYEAMESLLEEDRSLIETCQNNNRRIAKYLLGCDVNINAKNEKGNTALHICYQFNYTTLAEFLIANGADETIKNNDGVLPHMMQKSP